MKILRKKLIESLSSVIKNKAEIVRSSIIKTKTRIDGRDPKTVRDIFAEVGTLPKSWIFFVYKR